MAMDSPMQKTLGLPDLLIEVLKSLDMRTLLLSQRVCTLWRDVIATTPELQRALFFEPELPTSPRALTDSTSRTRNPLLAEHFPCFFKENERHDGVNNLRALMISDNSAPGDIVKMPKSDSEIPPLSSREPYLRRGASWRRMLVQQPAAPILGFVENRGSTEQSFYHGQLDQTGTQGLRMGTLYDAAYAALASVISPCHIGVYWREPQYDPPVPPEGTYARQNGDSEIALSQLGEDVAVVVLVSRHSLDDVDNHVRPLVTPRDKLVDVLLPEEWEDRPVALTWDSTQDWFG